MNSFSHITQIPTFPQITPIRYYEKTKELVDIEFLVDPNTHVDPSAYVEPTFPEETVFDKAIQFLNQDDVKLTELKLKKRNKNKHPSYSWNTNNLINTNDNSPQSIPLEQLTSETVYDEDPPINDGESDGEEDLNPTEDNLNNDSEDKDVDNGNKNEDNVINSIVLNTDDAINLIRDNEDKINNLTESMIRSVINEIQRTDTAFDKSISLEEGIHILNNYYHSVQTYKYEDSYPNFIFILKNRGADYDIVIAALLLYRLNNIKYDRTTMFNWPQFR